MGACTTKVPLPNNFELDIDNKIVSADGRRELTLSILEHQQNYSRYNAADRTRVSVAANKLAGAIKAADKVVASISFPLAADPAYAVPQDGCQDPQQQQLQTPRPVVTQPPQQAVTA